jgi:hypothetical protein
MIAASILQARGFRNFKEEDGFNLLPKQNYLKLILYVKQRFYNYSSRIKNI